MQEIKVGLAGLGHVGSAAVKILQANRSNFSRRLGSSISLSWVCDRHPGKKLKNLSLPKSVKVTTNYRDLIEDPRVDVLIELMGGVADARRAVLGALQAGKHVITANKRLLSQHWDEIFRAAERHRKLVYFEASVAGAIPILQAVQNSLAANEIQEVLGILNGTTNYILTRMIHDRMSFDAALRRAQELGFAEKDPTLDLNGSDTVHKLSILASLVTGLRVPPGRIHREGIAGIDLNDVLFAGGELGRTVRLLGILRLQRRGGKNFYEARVHPALIEQKHPLASVHDEYNAVLLKTSYAGDQMFYGKGAGAEPAASAVLGDLFMLAKAITAQKSANSNRMIWSGHGAAEIIPMAELECEFFLKFFAKDMPGILSRITGVLGRHGISISQIYQKFDKHPAGVPIVFVTHSAKEAAVQKAVAAITRLPHVASKSVCLRML
ncbi:MAG: homoserine dehydrogenase [Elusimicrobia bacterium]|nr:homoserine dehydrogenase [Elusimicrobiota bacterium]